MAVVPMPRREFAVRPIACVPSGRVVGLSKMARVVEVFARRLQVQERLTDRIADALVEKQNSKTITSALRGSFREDRSTREEFLRLVHGR